MWPATGGTCSVPEPSNCDPSGGQPGFEFSIGDGNRVTSITLLWYGLEALVPYGELELSAVLFGAVDDGGGFALLLNVFVGLQTTRHSAARAQARTAPGADRFD